MGNFDQDIDGGESTQPNGEASALNVATFDVPNHVVLAGQDAAFATQFLDSAARRGWFAYRDTSFDSLLHRVAVMPPGGLVLLDTSILSDRSGAERLTLLSELPVLPRIYLTASQMDVSALAVREICLAASIPVQDILMLPLEPAMIDTLLGT